MKGTRNTRLLWRGLARLAAVTAAVAITALLPVDWSAVGCRISLTAAGLRQPANAAALLEQRLEETDAPLAAAPAPPSQATTESTLPQSKPDITPDTSPAVTETMAALSITPPGEKGNGGKILEKRLDGSKNIVSGVSLLNKSGTQVDIAAALARPLTQTFTDTADPQVLIVHTHTTEQFMLYDAGYYNDGDRDRTKDKRQNVCAVGKAVAAQLKAAGIGVIHDTTVHDSPQYTGAYNRSADTVAAYLKKYPTIKVVLDLHRDAIMESDTTITKPTVEIGGKKAAQMMIIAGVVSTGTNPHPHWQQNLTLAANWQKALNTTYPGLMRPLYTVAARYNQHLSPGCLLVEVGSEANTVAEVTYSAQLLGDSLAKLLKAD